MTSSCKSDASPFKIEQILASLAIVNDPPQHTCTPVPVGGTGLRSFFGEDKGPLLLLLPLPVFVSFKLVTLSLVWA